MSDRLAADAARKRILVARGALQRVELRASVEGLQEGLRPRSLLSSAMGASGAGSMLIGLAARFAGATPAGRVLRFLGTALAVAGMLKTALASRRKG